MTQRAEVIMDLQADVPARPFLFVLQDRESGAVLFLGRVADSPA